MSVIGCDRRSHRWCTKVCVCVMIGIKASGMRIVSLPSTSSGQRWQHQNLIHTKPIVTNPATPITILAVNSDHGLRMPGRKLGPWSEFPFLYRLTVLLNSGGSNSLWSEFWSEFPHFMGMGVVPAPSTLKGSN